MTDYVQGFWDAVLMIRDNGFSASPNVEFWFYAGDQRTDFGLVQFEKRVNGVTTVFSVSLRPYMGWVQISVDNAIPTQYVTFQLDTNLNAVKTGKPGPNYPYTYTTLIDRPSIPSPPSPPYFFFIGVDSVKLGWDSPENNGGATVLEYQVGYGTNPASPTFTISANPGVTINNLAMGTVYYFWVRARNYEGWSNWSTLNSVRTYVGAYVNTGGVWKIAIPYINVAGTWKEAEPIVHHS
jgi:fibronectin type III domain protein